jgi:hypothetical protein
MIKNVNFVLSFLVDRKENFGVWHKVNLILGIKFIYYIETIWQH